MAPNGNCHAPNRTQSARAGRVLRQHVDKEAQRAHVLRDVVQRLRLVRRIDLAARQRLHRRLHMTYRLSRIVLVQHRQGALQLVQHRLQLRQGRALRLVCVIVVQHLLHLAQADLHFPGQRNDRVVLLHLPGQAVLPLRRLRRRDASHQRLQTRADGVRMRREVVRQMTDVLQAMLGKQQGRRHLQRQFLAAAGADRAPRHVRQLAQQRSQRR